jgi:O-antigen/teichoic acid export membrane protein
VVPLALSGILFTSVSWALAQKDEALAQRYIQEAARFAFIVIVPSCVLLAFHSETVMVLLFSEIYATGGIYLSLHLIAFGLTVFLDLFFNALMAAGKHDQSATILLALIPVALLLNVVLISHFGAMGAATSLVVTVCLGTIVGSVLVYRQFGTWIRLSAAARVILATALVALIDTQIPISGSWVLAKIVALLGIYFLLLGLLKELTWQDLNAFALWQSKAP